MRYYYILFLSVILFEGACHLRKETLDSQLSGSYTGVSPCLNCRGVYTKVIFQQEGSVRMTSDRDDVKALWGRTGCWTIGEDSIIRVGIGSDTLYFRFLSPMQIMSVYKDRENPVQLNNGYLLQKYSTGKDL